MKQSKRAFTLVELLITIAIIAILGLVSIIGYSSITRKASLEYDEAIVLKMNLALEVQEELENKARYCDEAVDQCIKYGLIFENLIPTTNGYYLAYDQGNNRFMLLDNHYAFVYGAENHTDLEVEPWNIFVLVGNEKEISKAVNEKDGNFSVYLRNDFKFRNTKYAIDVKAGIDTGKCFDVKIINYNSELANEVVIHTNSFSTRINVDAPIGTVYHYGFSAIISIEAINSASFDECGIVGRVEIKEGHFNACAGSEIFCLMENPKFDGAVVPTTVDEKAIIHEEISNLNAAKGVSKENGIANGLVNDCGPGRHTLSNDSYVVDSEHVYEVCVVCGYTLITVRDKNGTEIKQSRNKLSLVDGCYVVDEETGEKITPVEVYYTETKIPYKLVDGVKVIDLNNFKPNDNLDIVDKLIEDSPVIDPEQPVEVECKHTYVISDGGSKCKYTCSKCKTVFYKTHTYVNGVCSKCGHLDDRKPVMVLNPSPYSVTYMTLEEFRDSVNSGTSYKDKVVTLLRDITLVDNWTPIGTRNEPFEGEFNGCGYKIKGLKTNQSKGYFGLFGYVNGEVYIHDLTLENVDIKTNGPKVAALIASSVSDYDEQSDAYCKLTIENVEVSGSVSGKQAVAGFIGQAAPWVSLKTSVYYEGYMHFINCTNKADITGEYGTVSGILGYTSYLPVDSNRNTVSFINCTNEGTIRVGTSDIKIGRAAGMCASLNQANTAGSLQNKAEVLAMIEQLGSVSAYIDTITSSFYYENCVNKGDIYSEGYAYELFSDVGYCNGIYRSIVLFKNCADNEENPRATIKQGSKRPFNNNDDNYFVISYLDSSYETTIANFKSSTGIYVKEIKNMLDVGGTWTLLKDFYRSSDENMAVTKAVVVDLNGNTVHFEIEDNGGKASYLPYFKAKENGNITIKNGIVKFSKTGTGESNILICREFADELVRFEDCTVLLGNNLYCGKFGTASIENCYDTSSYELKAGRVEETYLKYYVCKLDYECKHSTINHVLAKDSTLTEYGNIEFYQCDICKMAFSDVNGDNEITLESTKIDKLKYPFTCINEDSNKGKNATTIAEVCGINAAVGGNWVLNKDYEIDKANTIKVGANNISQIYRIQKNATIDLCGYTLVLKGNDKYLFLGTGSITFKNGTIIIEKSSNYTGDVYITTKSSNLVRFENCLVKVTGGSGNVSKTYDSTNFAITNVQEEASYQCYAIVESSNVDANKNIINGTYSFNPSQFIDSSLYKVQENTGSYSVVEK